MLIHWQSHQEYKAFLHEAKVHFDPSQRHRLFTLSAVRAKLVSLDLDPVMRSLEPLYSSTGRPALHQAQILRSFILYALLQSQGYRFGLTSWVLRLKDDPVLAALVGCPVGSLPPLGSYFDFMDRLWDSPYQDRYSRKKTFPPDKNKRRPDKPAGKGQKAKEKKSGIVARLASRLENGKDIPANFEKILQQILFIAAVRPSIRKRLIPQNGLTVSGDGTCVHTHASPYGKRLSDCQFHDTCACHDKCFRHFSDPDASSGWDSDLEDWYFGYTLYLLSCHNPDAAVDLPLLARFTDAKRHDSVNILVALNEFRKHAPDITIRNLCLDAAHDNYPTYQLLKKWNIIPFIDLNKRCGRPKSIPDTIQIDTDGTPVCSAGHRMVCWGYDPSKHSIKWRCPYVLGKVAECHCICSSSSYGRTVHTKTNWDIRLYTSVPRGTPEWKNIYKNRTASERINNRILNDYGLHTMRIHTKKHYSFMTMVICICIHLDAWHKTHKTQATV